MTFSFAVRTVPQRKELFDQLMMQLYAEAHRGEPHVTGISINDQTDITPNENGCRALDAAEPADWVVFLEDDAGLIDDFLPSVQRWLNDFSHPDIHVYPLGCQYMESWLGCQDMWPYMLRDYYCSVAFVIRPTMIASLTRFVRSMPHVRQGFDRLVAEWHAAVSPSTCLRTPIPCFVEHLGDDSTLLDGRPDRNVVGRFRGFRGYDFSYRGKRNG